VTATAPAASRVYGRAGLIGAYYRATPLFFLADIGLGLGFRAVALPEGWSRLAYYGLCFACALAIELWPRRAAFVALGESALNMLLLILRVWLPLMGAYDSALSGQPIEAGLAPAAAVGFMVSGIIGWLSFQRAQARLLS
jgi:hypothetical protein